MNETPLSPNVTRYGAPIGLETARKVMEAAEAEAAKNGWPMVVAIADSGGNLVMLHRMEQAQTGSIAVAIRKAETAANFRRPTKVFEDAVAAGGRHLRILGLTDILPLEGGVPLLSDGVIVGAIGVSGMQSNEDEQVAQAGAAVLSAKP